MPEFERSRETPPTEQKGTRRYTNTPKLHRYAHLHVAGFLLADHDGVAQIKVHQRDHLVVRRLKERVRNVPAKYCTTLSDLSAQSQMSQQISRLHSRRHTSRNARAH